MYNIRFFIIIVVGSLKLHIVEIIIQNNWYAKFPFKKIKIIFSLTMYSFSTFFFSLNEFSALQKCWIDRLLERRLLFIPQMRTAWAAAGEASTFRQVELSKKKIHTPVNTI